MRTINLEVKDIKFSMESTKNVQNMNPQLSNKILTKWTLHCPFIIIKSSLEFHSMFPAKHQKIVKGRAKKKPSKLCSTYSHHHRRLGESWRDRVFFCHPCLANVHCFIVGLDSMYALCTTGLGAPWWRDPNFTYAPSPSSCRWKAALNGFFSRPLFFLGSNNAGEYWTVQHSGTVQWIFPPYKIIGRFKSVWTPRT